MASVQAKVDQKAKAFVDAKQQNFGSELSEGTVQVPFMSASLSCSQTTGIAWGVGGWRGVKWKHQPMGRCVKPISYH